jgi:hypothetical protein
MLIGLGLGATNILVMSREGTDVFFISYIPYRDTFVVDELAQKGRYTQDWHSVES